MATFRDIHDHLYAAFGPQHWWPAETPFEVAVGAVLTQNTAWRNVERTIAALKARDWLTPQALAQVETERLAQAIRPTGYFNVKAHRLQALCNFLLESTGGQLEALAREATASLRARLLAVPGIGQETADSILLYALGHPIFVVDAYTRRIFERLALIEPGRSYSAIQTAFETALPRDRALFNEYHALIVALGKDYCRPRPRCGQCPIRSFCPYPS